MAHVPRLFRPGRIERGPITLEGDHARRLSSVLRLRPGDEFLLFAGDGREWRARVTSSGRDTIHAAVLDVTRQEPAPSLTLEVWCALVRATRFELAVEKCTEAGADIIRPLVTSHTARADQLSPTRRERLERIAIEAAEQSGRLTVPVIAQATDVLRALDRAPGPVILGDPGGLPWPQMAALLPQSGHVAVAVGPEGGWSPAEIAAARAHGALVTRTGPTILRTETAAIVFTALVRAAT
jgi:16S rRNA (uracil1498-N3)-methyltransferase